MAELAVLTVTSGTLQDLMDRVHPLGLVEPVELKIKTVPQLMRFPTVQVAGVLGVIHLVLETLVVQEVQAAPQV